MLTGTVKAWNDDRGYGFIVPDDGGADVFVHAKSIIGASTLQLSQAVEFEVRKNNGSWNVNGSANPATGIRGITITSGSYAPYVRFSNATSGEVLTGNFGATAYTNAAPSGFGNWA